MNYTPIPLLVVPALPATPQPPLVPTIDLSTPLDVLIDQYRAARDKKAELEAEHKERLEPVTKTLADLDDRIQRTLTLTGQSSARTETGTAYLTTKVSYTVEDPAAFRAWVAANGNGVALFANSLAKEPVEEYLKSTNTLPPGVKASSVQALRVNKPTSSK